MEVMLNDFALSKETQATFLDISKKNLGIDFSITVLNTIKCVLENVITPRSVPDFQPTLSESVPVKILQVGRVHDSAM